MKSPIGIEFTGNCLTVLTHTLLAKAPEEGCALLIGNEKESSCFQKDNGLQIQMVWPCCNVWGQDILLFDKSVRKLNSALKEDLSKTHRFLIDPREQLLAQHWARKHNWEIVGSAHSHPKGDPIPSLIDRSCSFSNGIMVIIGTCGQIRAWWMSANQTFLPKEVAIWERK